MPRFRAVVTKTTISRELVEVDAASITDASRKIEQYADGVTSARRGVRIITTHDEDGSASETRSVVSVKEV